MAKPDWSTSEGRPLGAHFQYSNAGYVLVATGRLTPSNGSAPVQVAEPRAPSDTQARLATIDGFCCLRDFVAECLVSEVW